MNTDPSPTAQAARATDYGHAKPLPISSGRSQPC